MGLLLGSWDDHTDTLTITRPNGQRREVKNSSITAGSHKVFGVETVGNEIHVLTGPRSASRPNRRAKFNDSCSYKGNNSL